MIKNFFKSAFRNLLRHKAFSTINIGGLSIGMASAILTVSYQSVKASLANPVKSLRTE